MAFTYSTLKTEIQDWAENDSTEFVAKLDTIIDLAELKVVRETDLDTFRKYATASLTASDKYLIKPTDMVIDRYLKVVNAAGLYNDVRWKDVSFIQEYWPDATVEGLPKYYSDWDALQFVLAPVPDTTYTVELAYTYRPTGLSDSNTTTWLSTYASDVLLWACLIEAASFMKEMPADANEWKTKYIEARDSLMLEELKRQRRDEARHGEARGGD
jgi:hypothetical protein